jgi:hypothetical protein
VVTSDRRNHRRLRELCDEVLASHRVASGEDLFSDADRLAGAMIFSRIAPAGVARRS